MSKASRHMARVASLGCVVCRNLGFGPTPRKGALSMEVGLIGLGIVILAGGIAIGVGACFAWAYHAMGGGE